VNLYNKHGAARYLRVVATQTSGGSGSQTQTLLVPTTTPQTFTMPTLTAGTWDVKAYCSKDNKSFSQEAVWTGLVFTAGQTYTRPLNSEGAIHTFSGTAYKDADC